MASTSRFLSLLPLLFSLIFFLNSALSAVPPASSPSLPPKSPTDKISPSPAISPNAPSPSFSSPPAPPPSDLAPNSPTPTPVQREHENKPNAGNIETREKSSGGMSGGKKAGVAIGVIAGALVVGAGALLYKKRQQNIQRSQYGYTARREIL